MRRAAEFRHALGELETMDLSKLYPSKSVSLVLVLAPKTRDGDVTIRNSSSAGFKLRCHAGKAGNEIETCILARIMDTCLG